MLFYAAIHYVEAYLVSTRGFGCKHHFSRVNELQKDPRLKPLFNDYSLLENLSREARYDVTPFNAGDMRCAENCFEIIKKTIEAIL
jgi:hypothetical protein